MASDRYTRTLPMKRNIVDVCKKGWKIRLPHDQQRGIGPGANGFQRMLAPPASIRYDDIVALVFLLSDRKSGFPIAVPHIRKSESPAKESPHNVKSGYLQFESYAAYRKLKCTCFLKKVWALVFTSLTSAPAGKRTPDQY
jgi:hypothetical protein